MRTPKNTSRLPRERTHVVRIAANAAFGALAQENQFFALPSGAQQGDSISLTLVGPGDPLDNANVAMCLFTPSINSAQLIVSVRNLTNAQIARAVVDVRITYRRP
jgi:hypothetical protein